MTHWQEIIRKLIAPAASGPIGVVGKYIELQDAYKSVYEAIIHGGVANDCGVEIEKVDAEDIESIGAEKILKGLAAFWFRAVLGSAASRARLWPRNMRAKQTCLTWALPRYADRHDRIRPQRA